MLAAGDQERAATVLVRLQQDMITAGTRPLSRIAGARPLLERLERGVGAEPAARVLLGTSYGYACRFEEAQAEKYDLIVNEAYYVNPRVDITDRVMSQLDSSK